MLYRVTLYQGSTVMFRLALVTLTFCSARPRNETMKVERTFRHDARPHMIRWKMSMISSFTHLVSYSDLRSKCKMPLIFSNLFELWQTFFCSTPTLLIFYSDPFFLFTGSNLHTLKTNLSTEIKKKRIQARKSIGKPEQKTGFNSCLFHLLRS